MKKIPSKIKPKAGFAHFIHIGFVTLLPLFLLILVRLRFYEFSIGLALILLSKWRMFAVKPHHWPASIRANGVDLVVGISILIFMIQANSGLVQVLWALVYGGWLLILKKQSSDLGVSLQALSAQALGISALMRVGADYNIVALVALTWVISYTAARHFFANFEEPILRFLSAFWGYFAAALVWLLAHWLLFYGPVAQVSILLTVIGFGLGGLYYLEKSDKGSLAMRRQIVFVLFAVTVIVIAFSDWGDKAFK